MEYESDVRVVLRSCVIIFSKFEVQGSYRDDAYAYKKPFISSFKS